MAKNQELELSILIGGHVDNSLAQAVKLANTQIGSIANGASKFAENIAKGAVAAAGGIAAAVVDTTKESVSFESEMLDVTKYVSGLTDDSGKVIRSNYEEMSKDILDLSTDIPYTAEELTRLAAAAGQSGKSMDDLISDGFLRDVAEMGTAMDISADQAGDWAAKWEVAFDINHDQVMELADQINYLGAHYATTAAEIAQTVNDTGSLGQIAGMDVASTAALSTALLAMGVDSGKVATSIRRMYTNLSMGSKATDAQAAAFEQLGFTAEQFAKDMQTDAPAAIKSLFTAIGSQPKDKQVGYLKTLLGQWAIESGAKLTGNLDLFIKTLDDVGDASKYNGSMYKEFLLKCETSESVLTMLSNAWRAVRIEVGNNFLPIPSIGQQPQSSFMKNIATKANGAGVGLWATLKNFTGLTKNDGKTKIDFVRDVMGASERGQTIRQSFPYINGVMSAASDFGKTKIASGIGGVTKQIFTGIIGPNGIDVAKLAGGLKNFGGATAAVFGAMPGNAAKAGVNFLSKMNFANGTGLGRTIYRMANSTQGLSGKAALAQMGYIFNQTRPGQVLSGATGFVKNAAPAVADFGGKAFGLGKAVASPVLKGGFNIFAGLMSTFGPVIAGLGSVIAVVSLLGDHFEDIRQIIGQVFGEKGLTLFDGFTGKVQGIAGNIHDTLAGAFSLENLQNIQQSLSGKSILGIDDLGTTFGAVIPIIESVKGLIGQIVDLGVNHIKPLLADVLSFAVNDLFPAVSPLISMIISLVGTTLINAIKLVVDVIHGLLPVIEPVIQSIVGLIKGIVSVTITVVNGIIRALNSFSFTVPQWLENVPVAKNFAGKTFGFNLSEVAMPAFANGGFTRGVSIAGEAGTEAVISFKPSVHDSNVENWVRAGRMLGVSGEDATRAAGVQNVQYFANGGFTDGSKEKLDKLIDFSNAYGEYALRSNGIKSTGDVVSMMWTVANNAMSGDGSLELVATSIAADVAPIILNKYLGSDSTITKAVTEAAKTYNGGTVLSSWENGVLTDTGTPLYMLSQQDVAQPPATEAPDVPAETYQTAKESAENSASATGNEKLDNLIDFSKAYADYALRSNGIRTAGDAASMLWTVANNSLAGDGSLALAATSIAADVAPLVLNKYFGGDSTITSMLTEAAKTYNGGTVLSSWENGALTDTGTPLYMLSQRDTEKTLPDMPSSAYRAAGGGDGGSSSSIKDSQFVFSPHITVGSGTNMEELEREMRKLFEEFKQEMREEEREQGRVKYAS